MPRLINVEDALEVLNTLNSQGRIEYTAYSELYDTISMIDAEPVRHGHWINHYDDLFPAESTQECSVCHAEQMLTMLDDNYCPNCGAKMDEEEENEAVS